MAAELLPMFARGADSNNNILSGAKWYFYATGTSTPQDVYTTSGLGTPHANPVVADAGGKFAAIYFDASLQYRGVLKDSTGATTIFDIDPINAQILSVLAQSSGSSLVNFIQAGAGAVARTVQSKLRDVISAKDFGATGDGVTDDTAALQAWLDAVQNGGGYLPRGIYNHTGLTLDPEYSYNITGDAYDNGAIGGSALVNTGTGGGHAITIDNTPFTIPYDSQIRFTNLTIKGNTLSGDGFHVEQTMVFLENVWITGHGGHGYWAQRCYSSAFRQVSFSNNTLSGFFGTRALNAVHFDHCLFNGNAATAGNSGCNLSGAAGADRNFGVLFSSCDFTGNGDGLAAGDAYGIVIQNCSGITLNGCYAEGNYTYNLYADSSTYGLTINGCFFQDSHVFISEVNGLNFINNELYDSGTAATTTLTLDAGLPDKRLEWNVQGTTYTGTVVKTFTGGANELHGWHYTSAPTGGTWKRGDRVWNELANSGGAIIGWVCIVAGTPGTWLPMGVLPQVYADQGDASATLTVGGSFPTNIWTSPITADRSAALSTTGAFSGAKFRVVRKASATGAFNLNVGTGPLKALAAGEWCDVEYDGSSWALTAFGTL